MDHVETKFSLEGYPNVAQHIGGQPLYGRDQYDKWSRLGVVPWGPAHFFKKSKRCPRDVAMGGIKSLVHIGFTHKVLPSHP